MKKLLLFTLLTCTAATMQGRIIYLDNETNHTIEAAAGPHANGAPMLGTQKITLAPGAESIPLTFTEAVSMHPAKISVRVGQSGDHITLSILRRDTKFVVRTDNDHESGIGLHRLRSRSPSPYRK